MNKWTIRTLLIFVPALEATSSKAEVKQARNFHESTSPSEKFRVGFARSAISIVTNGALVNHVWSFAGHDNRQRISSTYLQPFLSYTTKSHTTFHVNTESTYDWANSEWTVPINATITQLVKVGKRPVSFQFGGRYYADKPSGGPDWGLRFTMTFVFPTS